MRRPNPQALVHLGEPCLNIDLLVRVNFDSQMPNGFKGMTFNSDIFIEERVSRIAT